MKEDAAAALAETLTSGKWTHDYPIDAEEARGLGLKVSTDMPEEVIDLMQLYPQPMTTSPAVEYLPNPARRIAGRPH
jgi:ClpP class serine protease